MASKLRRDLLSVKLWLVVLATTLLLARKIGAEHWVAVVAGFGVLREASNLRHSRLGRDEENDH